jgi:elongation factor P
MMFASDVKDGAVLSMNDGLHKVTEVIHHSGTGQMHGFILLKTKNVRTGHIHEQRFKSSDRLSDITLSKRQVDYIYHDDDTYYFMDPQTFEQFGVPRVSVGANIGRFLREGLRVTVELLENEALTVEFPKTVELKVSLTSSGIREAQDNTMKPATLENGIEILVPQFVHVGDLVRVDVESGRYIDRVPLKKI